MFCKLSDVDYERRQVYSYRVVASDAGHPSRSATSDLDVEVLDIDDEPPHFDVIEYHFHVAENLPVGTVVGRVEAADRDHDPDFRQVSYFADGQRSDSEYLVVDRLTGEIRTSAVLDRELTPSLTLRVFAADRPEVTSSSCDVIVHVTDENDHAPELVFPSDGNRTVLIGGGEGVGVGSRLAQLEAVDRDEGINANLTFFIDNDDRQLGLDIESTSGLLNDD